MERIIKKAKEVREAVIESFKDIGFNTLEVDYAINTNEGKFDKIKFFDTEITTEPCGNNYYFEVTYFDEAFVYFGEQTRGDFALNSKALKSIAELCEVVNEYLKESEKEENETKDISNK